jgi:uncharacterized membrane protein
LLVFGSAISYALFLVWQGKLVHRYGPRFFAAGCMLFSFAAYFVQFLLLYPLSALAQPRPVLWMSAFTAIFSNVVPTFLFAYAVKLAGAGPTSVAGTVGPVSTLLLSSWLLGERPGWPQILGLALVVTGALRLAAGGKPGDQGPVSPPSGSRGASGAGAEGSVPKSASGFARGKAAAPELSDPAASAAAFLASAKGRGSLAWARGRSHSRSA